MITHSDFAGKTKNNPKEIIIFGDSINDNGNFFHELGSSALLPGIRMTTPSSAKGGTVFCNGKLIAERIAEHYGYKCDPAWKIKGGNNYSVACATIVAERGMNSVIHAILHNLHSSLDMDHYTLRKQIDKCIKDIAKKGEDAKEKDVLFFIAIGSNDILLAVKNNSLTLDQKKAEIKKAAVEMVKCIEHLKITFPKSMCIVFGHPDIAYTPRFYIPEDQKRKNGQFTQKEELWKHAHILSEELRDLTKELIQQSEVIETCSVPYIDISLQIQKILENWPEDKRYKPAVHNSIIDGISVKTIGACISQQLGIHALGQCELEGEFVDDATQEDLDSGEYAFYDELHGTAQLYSELSIAILKELKLYLSSPKKALPLPCERTIQKDLLCAQPANMVVSEGARIEHQGRVEFVKVEQIKSGVEIKIAIV